MSFWERVFNRNREIVIFDDAELYNDQSKRTSLKRVALESVIGMMSRTIIQSEFRVKESDKYIKNSMYYRFNVKPNKNQSASAFWSEVIRKLIYDGECLIVKSRNDDLLIADDFEREEKAVYEDIFKHVYVRGLELDGDFSRGDVLYLDYGNEKLSTLVDSLFYDYGMMLDRLIDFRLRKSQIRATVDIDANFSKTEESQKRVQDFISKTYAAIKDKAVAIIPQQKGLEYKEHSGKASTSGESIDEIDKITNGFLSQIALSVGMPVSFLKGDMADIDKITRNYMKFCIDPIVEIINDELNRQFISERDYLNGNKINVKRVSYKDMFDHAVAIDKLIASGAFKGNEIRDEVGYDQTDEEIHETYYITKNYQTADEALSTDD